ncbi:MAG: hypothetical protein K8R59_04825 [Thermoanaerobaculales bacterium]|nr:hypothetical protein [Thermoanaerobaculales bacterium]
MQRFLLFVLIPAAVMAASGIADAGTCDHAYMAEGQPAPAFDGINNTETGFTSYYWAWGANPSDQGSALALLVDDATGIAVNPGILWANSDSCSGIVEGVGLLVEAQSTSNGGKFAVVALQGVEIEIDYLQAGTQSSAQTIPVPAVTGYDIGTDGFGGYADITLQWSAPSSSAWALSDVTAVHVGYAVYSITAGAGGPVDNGDRSQFIRVEATPGTAPYINDDSDTADGLLPASQLSCLVRIRQGEVYYFALSLIFDGSGAAGGDPQADASAVESTYVGACSAAADFDPVIFADGFESGDTTAWSDTVP